MANTTIQIREGVLADTVATGEHWLAAGLARINAYRERRKAARRLGEFDADRLRDIGLADEGHNAAIRIDPRTMIDLNSMR